MRTIVETLRKKLVDGIMDAIGKATLRELGENPRSERAALGGLARAASLSPSEKSESASKAARARWKPKPPKHEVDANGHLMAHLTQAGDRFFLTCGNQTWTQGRKRRLVAMARRLGLTLVDQT